MRVCVSIKVARAAGVTAKGCLFDRESARAQSPPAAAALSWGERRGGVTAWAPHQ